MPILYDEKSRVIHLQGKKTSVCLYIDETYGLLNLHWGKRLSDGDVTYLMEGYSAGASFDLRHSRFPYDVPVRGGGMYQMPCVCAVNEKGNDLVKLTYVNHVISKGKLPIEGLPQVYTESDDEAENVEITLKDTLTGMVVRVRYTLLEETDVITRSMLIENTGNEKLTLTHMQSASVPLSGTDYDVINLCGAWARERHVSRTPIAHYGVRVESQRGASGHEQNPFIALAKKDANEFYGNVWAMTLVYSGSFLASCEVNNFDTTRVSIGLNPEVCRWQLLPGASFQTPEAILVYSDQGLNGMSHKFHKVIGKRVVRGKWRDKVRPILINNWEATKFNFDEEMILRFAKKAAGLGVELFVLDDGWFGKRNNDKSSLGDWFVNKEKLPSGICGLAKKINEMGMEFGLWFEPEMISPDSELYRAHPDWCLHVDGRDRTEARQQLILDLSRREIQDYLIETVSKTLREAPIAYVKWDMNRNMTEYFSACAKPENQLETQHRYMLGLYRVLEEITGAFPEVLFESCSGGGGRFDAGMLYYMPQTWTSDDTCAVERLKIQYGTSFVYPASTMGAHVTEVPNHQTRRMTSVSMRANVALGGNFGFELDLNKLPDDEIEQVRETIELVKKVRGTLQQGEFTRLESPFESNFAVWQFISEDGNDAILCAYRRLTMSNVYSKRVYMRDLDENAVYVHTETGKAYTGSMLMYAGILFPDERNDFTSKVYAFKKQ